MLVGSSWGGKEQGKKGGRSDDLATGQVATQMEDITTWKHRKDNREQATQGGCLASTLSMLEDLVSLRPAGEPLQEQRDEEDRAATVGTQK